MCKRSPNRDETGKRLLGIITPTSVKENRLRKTTLPELFFYEHDRNFGDIFRISNGISQICNSPFPFNSIREAVFGGRYQLTSFPRAQNEKKNRIGNVRSVGSRERE